MKRKFILNILVLLFFVIALLAFSYYYFISKAFDIATNIIPDEEMDASIPGEVGEDSIGLDDGKAQVPAPEGENAPKSVPEAVKDSEPENTAPLQEKRPHPSDLGKQVSFEDKRRIVQLVTSRLSSSDIKYLLSLAKGGLTEDEKKRAVKLAYERFTPEEIDEIKLLYARYKKYVK